MFATAPTTLELMIGELEVSNQAITARFVFDKLEEFLK
jgi:hypothetical protein